MPIHIIIIKSITGNIYGANSGQETPAIVKASKNIGIRIINTASTVAIIIKVIDAFCILFIIQSPKLLYYEPFSLMFV